VDQYRAREPGSPETPSEMSHLFITLRDLHEDDLPIFFAHQADPIAASMAVFASRDWEAFSQHWKTKVLGAPGVRNKTVLRGAEVAGYVACFEQEGKRLVAYWIGREFWGRGVATAALAAFLKLEPARPLFAFVATSNVGSVRVLSKCGFAVVSREPAPDGVEEFLMQFDGA
jgi:RimJ/RimL family protein N-acetyltransferase